MPADPQRTSSNERFEALFGHSPSPAALLDRNGRLTRVNAAFEVVFRRTADELVGHELAEFVEIEHEIFEESADPRFAGLRLPDAGDRDVSGRLILVPISDDSGNVVEFIAQIEDTSPSQELRDPLTGLQTRLLFVDRLTHALARSERMLGPVAVLFVNLDHFKSINERYGHAAGDAVLRATAKKLQSVVRPSDTVARMGGDEFAVLCEDMKGETGAVVVAERLFTALQEPIPLEPEPVVVSASIGIAFAQEGDDPDTLMRNADAAMYRVKEGGRGTYEIYLDAL